MHSCNTTIERNYKQIRKDSKCQEKKTQRINGNKAGEMKACQLKVISKVLKTIISVYAMILL